MHLWIGNAPIIIFTATSAVILLLSIFVDTSDEYVTTGKSNFPGSKMEGELQGDNYLINVFMLFRNKGFLLILLLSIVHIGGRKIFNIYFPMSLYQCYGFTPRYVAIFGLIKALFELLFLALISFTARYIHNITIINVNLFFYFILICIQCFSYGGLFCDLMLLINIYSESVTIVIRHNFMVTLVGQISSNKQRATAQSTFLIVTSIFGICVTVLCGYFANDKKPLLIGNAVCVFIAMCFSGFYRKLFK